MTRGKIPGNGVRKRRIENRRSLWASFNEIKIYAYPWGGAGLAACRPPSLRVSEDRRRTCTDNENFKSLCRRILKALTPGDRRPSVLGGASVIRDAVSRAFSLFTFFFYLFPPSVSSRVLLSRPRGRLLASHLPPHTHTHRHHTYIFNAAPKSPSVRVKTKRKKKLEDNSKTKTRTYGARVPREPGGIKTYRTVWRTRGEFPENFNRPKVSKVFVYSFLFSPFALSRQTDRGMRRVLQLAALVLSMTAGRPARGGSWTCPSDCICLSHTQVSLPNAANVTITVVHAHMCAVAARVKACTFRTKKELQCLCFYASYAGEN